MKTNERILAAIALCACLGAAGLARSQSELVAPSLLTVRAPTISGGAELEMEPLAAGGAIGRVKGTVGQSSPLGNLVGFTSGALARTGFWPIAAMVDCGDAGDLDCDGLANDLDLCPYFNSQDQTDSDGNGIGDVCECSDQNGDGFVTVADIVAINAAIFTPALATPLCDGSGDRLCTVADIVSANGKIFGGESFCRRYPAPAP
jgi:hypothetical protein